MTITDLSRIERSILIKAPPGKVWRAITDPKQFAEWFSVEIEGAFEPGSRVRMTSTYSGCEGVVFYVTVQDMTPESRFSWTWQPGAAQPQEENPPSTLVVFTLEPAGDGTRLTVVESGFDRISLARRAAVYEENSKGWEIQTESLAQYVGRNA